MPPPTDPVTSSQNRPSRSPGEILSDIADVERELQEVPPHAASAGDLSDALERLRAELRAAESVRRDV